MSYQTYISKPVTESGPRGDEGPIEDCTWIGDTGPMGSEGELGPTGTTIFHTIFYTCFPCFVSGYLENSNKASSSSDFLTRLLFKLGVLYLAHVFPINRLSELVVLIGPNYPPFIVCIL